MLYKFEFFFAADIYMEILNEHVNRITRENDNRYSFKIVTSRN